MILLIRYLIASMNSLVEPLGRGLPLLDLLVIVLAQIKGFITSPLSLGQSARDQLDAVVQIERPFLEFAWLIAQMSLPMGWHGLRATQVVDTTLTSREPDRSINVRIITPTKIMVPPPASDGKKKRPLLILWMHGGGLFLGTGVGEGVLYRFFASRLNCTVVSIDYRRVPEASFPACIDDCEDVARALLSDPAYRDHRFLVAGMSAGGYLAIQLSLVLAHAGLPVDGHVAIAPMVRRLSKAARPLPSRHTLL